MQPTGVLDTAKATNPLKQLLTFGQSVWLDYIRRNLITSGELKRLIEEDGLRGMTSNPPSSKRPSPAASLYDDIAELAQRETDLNAKGHYENLAIRDIQDAADMLRPVYDKLEAARRLRQPGSFAVPRARNQGHARGGAPLCGRQWTRDN